MLDKSLYKKIDILNVKELRELKKYIDSLLPPSIVYQRKPIKCGCKQCREGGPGHGKYWYAYFTYKNKTHCIYIGKEKRDIDPLEELEKKQKRIKGGKK